MLSFAFGDGLAVAASSLLGQSLGQKRPDIAILVYGKTAQRFGLMIGALLCLGFILLRRVIILPFSSEPEIIALGSQIMYIIAVMCPAQISQVIFSNCLRVAWRYPLTSPLFRWSVSGLGRTVVAYFFTFTLGLGLIGAWISFLGSPGLPSDSVRSALQQGTLDNDQAVVACPGVSIHLYIKAVGSSSPLFCCG